MMAAPGERTLQRYADDYLLPQYRQSLKTAQEACNILGWTTDEPQCCGQAVKIDGFLGLPYHAECPVCGAMMHDMGGPSFGNSWVRTLDPKQFDEGALDVEARWIVIPAQGIEAGQSDD